MEKVKILLVEDDELASELIYNYFTDAGYAIVPVFTATDAMAHIKHEAYDIVILDINLPDFHGFEVIKGSRDETPLPIIITSAYSDTKTKLLAFEYGAVDYMVKPLDLEELEARIRLQITKNSGMKKEENPKLFSLNGHTILFKQQALSLTSIEFEVLCLLIKNANHITKREELIASLSSLSSQRSLDNHIKNIRKKINDDGHKAQYLKTVYGMGYLLINE
jgi:DNA-binding response OmpR family regulator